MNNPERLLSVGQVAEKLGVSTSLVKRWLAQGRMRGRKIGPALKTPGGKIAGYWAIRESDAIRPEPLKPGRPRLYYD